ncbi:MAG TPA: SDR family oxidoreductase, partial [Limnochordia bacterium]
MAERCAAEGALVAIADIDNDSGAAAAAGLGDAALFVPMDVRDAASVEAGVEAVLRRFGRLDGLIQCAGASGRHHGDGPAADCAEAGWEWVIELNLRGVFLTCKYSLRAMLQGGGGA